MPVVTRKFIVREYIRKNREILFVFGDNSKRIGNGGQAAQMRGEPNSIGITTKKAPSNNPKAFFTDADYEKWKEENTRAFWVLKNHILKGGIVCIPEDGIGTNRADLARSSPIIWGSLQMFLTNLKEGKF